MFLGNVLVYCRSILFDMTIAHVILFCIKGASINALDDYHCTPLHICCLWDSIKCAQLLLTVSSFMKKS